MVKHPKIQLPIFRSLLKKRIYRTTVLVVSFCLVGIIVLLVTHAATPTVSIEPESGTKSANARPLTGDSTASGNGYVKFATTNTSALSVKVVGDHLVDQTGATIQLRGVNYSGTEFMCLRKAGDHLAFTTDPYIHGNNGVHSGTKMDYSDGANGFNGGVAGAGVGIAQTFLKWDKNGTPIAGPHAINVVRIPLNEACWLGTNNAPTSTSIPLNPTLYQQFIKRLVNQLTAQNMYVVLDDHRSAPGNNNADTQNVTLNADHSPTFWSQVATSYKDYPNVMFDLFNEPGIHCAGLAVSGCNPQKEWDAYMNGAAYTYQDNDNGNVGLSDANDNAVGNALTGQTFQFAGVKSIVNNIRNTAHANNPIIIETIGWGSGNMEIMGNNINVDPLASTSTGSQIVASFHQYHHNDTADVEGDWAGALNPSIAGKFPVYVGEFSYENEVFDPAWANNTLAWLDRHNYSHTAWSWDANQTVNNTLVSYPAGNDSGDPSQFGALVRSNLQSHQ